MNYKAKTIKESEVPSKVRKKVETAIKALIKEDKFLLFIDSSERSIAHKLAEHLQGKFSKWNVDCEYNRDSHDLSDLAKKLTKRLESWVTECKEKEKKEKGTAVSPDIIIHHRLNRENLLVIEIKKTTNKDDGSCDKEKIKAFIEELSYQYGLFINFKAEKKVGIDELQWFKRVKNDV